MQLHHEVTLSYLWHLVKHFSDFVKCDCKHSYYQCIVEDGNNCQVEYSDKDYLGYGHAEDGK